MSPPPPPPPVFLESPLEDGFSELLLILFCSKVGLGLHLWLPEVAIACLTALTAGVGVPGFGVPCLMLPGVPPCILGSTTGVPGWFGWGEWTTILPGWFGWGEWTTILPGVWTIVLLRGAFSQLCAMDMPGLLILEVIAGALIGPPDIPALPGFIPEVMLGLELAVRLAGVGVDALYGVRIGLLSGDREPCMGMEPPGPIGPI